MAEMETLINHKDYIVYRTSCECMDESCTLTLTLEREEYGEEYKISGLQGMISLTIDQKQFWYSDWRDKPLKMFWKRFIASMKMLFTGSLETHSSFIFRGENHIREMINTISQDLDKIEK